MLLTLEFIQIIFLLVYLGINSYFDVKTRYIYGEYKYHVIIGIAAFSLVLYGYMQEPNLDIFFIILPLIFFLIMFRFKKLSTGDIIILCVASAILPSTMYIPMFGMLSAVSALILVTVCLFGYNIILNAATLIKTHSLFPNNEMSLYKKIIFFFVSHEKKNNERWYECVTLKKSVLFVGSKPTPSFVENGTLVSSTLPFVPFLLLSSICWILYDFLYISRF